MTAQIIRYPHDTPQTGPRAGFTNWQFRMLDGLYLQAAAQKTLIHRSVDCDFEEGLATYSYHQTQHQSPVLQLVIRRVGPRTCMYEIYRAGKGRIMRTGIFEYAYSRLQDEVESFT